MRGFEVLRSRWFFTNMTFWRSRCFCIDRVMLCEDLDQGVFLLYWWHFQKFELAIFYDQGPYFRDSGVTFSWSSHTFLDTSLFLNQTTFLILTFYFCGGLFSLSRPLSWSRRRLLKIWHSHFQLFRPHFSDHTFNQRSKSRQPQTKSKRSIKNPSRTPLLLNTLLRAL